MPWWETVLDSLGLVAVIIVLTLCLLFVRRRWLSRGGDTFECSLRLTRPAKSSAAAAARGWTLGLARYTGDDLGVVPHLLLLAPPRATCSPEAWR